MALDAFFGRWSFREDMIYCFFPLGRIAFINYSQMDFSPVYILNWVFFFSTTCLKVVWSAILCLVLMKSTYWFTFFLWCAGVTPNAKPILVSLRMRPVHIVVVTDIFLVEQRSLYSILFTSLIFPDFNYIIHKEVSRKVIIKKHLEFQTGPGSTDMASVLAWYRDFFSTVTWLPPAVSLYILMTLVLMSSVLLLLQ